MTIRMLIEKIIILSVSILNMFNTTKITKPKKGGEVPELREEDMPVI